MGELLRRLRYLLRRQQFETDLAEEMDFHREMEEEALRGRGSHGDVRSAARRGLGSLSLAHDQSRDVWLWPWLMAFCRDLRFGGRLLRKNPAFSLTAVATLAVAIGANTAVYTLVDQLLFRPLPFPEPDRLAVLARHYERSGTSGVGYSQNGATWQALRDSVPVLDFAVAGSAGGATLLAGDRAAYVQQHRVSAGFFRVLGVSPALGREFTAGEDLAGGSQVAVLSHDLWVREFGGDPSAIGNQIVLRGEPFTVVGVMPSGFRSTVPADLWTPLRPTTQGEGAGQNYLVLARLTPDTDWADAAGQVHAVGTAFIRERLRPPADVTLTMGLVPLHEMLTSSAREPLVILWASVGLVLLLGCVNIAGLLLSRSSLRAAEIATRMALGGGRGAIVRQLLAESVILAACGGAAGVAVGFALAHYVSVRLQNVIGLPTTPDLRVMGVAVAGSAATVLVFGLFPALQASRRDVRSVLVESNGGAIGSPGRWPARVLVFGQVALAVVLAVGAALLLRSFLHVTNVAAGVDGTNVMTATASLQDARYRTSAAVNDLFNRSVERMRALPGVEGAAIALALPYERALNQSWQFPETLRPDAAQEPLSLTYVTPDYFETLRIPVVSGRAFTEADTESSAAVVLVNDAFVRRYSREANPIGRRIQLGQESKVAEIVGVVGDIQQQVTFGSYGPLAAIPAAYVPAAQVDDSGLALMHTWFEPSWIVRMADAEFPITPAMQEALREVDRRLLFNRFRTIGDLRAEATSMFRIQASLLGSLASFAVLLCALGVYGLVASTTGARRREFGLRIALGASALQIVQAATRSSVSLVLAGTVSGLLVAASLAQVLEASVFGIAVRDGVAFLSAAMVVIGAAGVAVLVPTIRTLRLDAATELNRR